MHNLKDKLYKGLFWIKDIKNIDEDTIYFLIPCDKAGKGDVSGYDSCVVSKSGDLLNHKKLWETLPSNITDNKSFDYYPRGRIEIKNGKVKIFMSIYLVEYKEEVIRFCKSKFNLTSNNGICNIDTVIDGSKHYMSKMSNL